MNKRKDIIRIVLGGVGLLLVVIGLMFVVAPIKVLRTASVLSVISGLIVIGFSGVIATIAQLNKLAKTKLSNNVHIRQIHRMSLIPLVGMFIAAIGVFISPLSASYGVSEINAYLWALTLLVFFYIVALCLRVAELIVVNNDVDSLP